MDFDLTGRPISWSTALNLSRHATAFFACTLAAASAMVPRPAAAEVPAATGSVSCTNAISPPASSCSFLGSSGTLTLDPVASIELNVNSDGTFETGGSGATGYLSYYFQVLGPGAGANVPVDIDFHLHQEIFNGSQASAYIYAIAGSFFPGDSDGAGICNELCGDLDTDLLGTLHIHPQVGYASQIFMSAEVNVHNFLHGATGGVAYVDPLIRIDPSFADAAEYSIVLSDGVANALPSTAPVPEPETWALMFSGLAVIAALARRRRPW